MFVSSLPTFGFQPGVRCAEAAAFEDRHPQIRFFNEPGGGAGGAGSGEGGGAGGAAGAGGAEGEQLGEGGRKALEDERRLRSDADKRASTAEAKNADLEKRLKDIEDGNLKPDEKFQRDFEASKTKNTELQSENDRLTLDNQRLLVAITEKVPAEWAERIKGATPDEMTADAKKIKASLRDEGAGDHTPGAGERGSDLKPESTPGFGRLRDAYSANQNKK